LAVTDEVLVAKCQEGERTAFELLVQKYQRRIFQLIYRLTQDSDMVEPLAQEVFFKAFRAIKSFKGNSQFYTWLYRIAVNTCLSHLKRDSPEDPWENPAEAAGANQHSDGLQPDDPETALLRKEFFNSCSGRSGACRRPEGYFGPAGVHGTQLRGDRRSDADTPGDGQIPNFPGQGAVERNDGVLSLQLT